MRLCDRWLSRAIICSDVRAFSSEIDVALVLFGGIQVSECLEIDDFILHIHGSPNRMEQSVSEANSTSRVPQPIVLGFWPSRCLSASSVPSGATVAACSLAPSVVGCSGPLLFAGLGSSLVLS